jgi:transcriptional regulator with PAS, ATPase and Fis domain
MEMRRQFVGSSAAAREVQLEIECAGRTDAKTLITGESGVGKEVVANMIHYESRRRFAPFVAINCAGIPDTLLESELFGHVRGSFTDAHRDKRGWLDQAQGGTIFLDEIGEMSNRMQAVLLRFLESGEIQRVGADRPHAIAAVRVIAATNRDLTARIAEKQFREDLYYRLNVIRIAIPPLRERKEDIEPLLTYFVRLASELHKIQTPVLHEETIARLLDYSWPGNVRELKNVVERLVVRSGTGTILPGDLPKELLAAWSRGTEPAAVTASKATSDRLFERMTLEGESFWSAVSEPFMSRDITRDDLRAVITKGLEHTKGSYKQLVQVFNIAPEDYKRLLSFLRKYGCHMPFQKFRTLPVRPEALAFRRDQAAQERFVKTG